MKTKLRRLALTAVLLSSTSMAFADQGESSAVGDLPGYGEDAYFDEEATYAESNYVAPAGHAGTAMHYAPRQSPLYAPVGASQLQPTSFVTGPSCDASCGCDYGCDGGCDSGCSIGGCNSGCGSKRGKLCGIFDRCDSDTWAQTEFLMWFLQDREMPALVTTSPINTQPVLGDPQTNVVFGNGVEGELSAGVRTDYGKWVTDNVGIGGRFWIMAENNDSFSAAGNGTGNSIGRPFLDLAFGGESALLVNLNGILTGAVAAENSIDIWAAEAYSRIRFSCAKNCRLDFIGGYSHFEIKDKLAIASTTTNLTAPQAGRTRSFSDFFEQENKFDGGQLGFEMVITRGKWMARSLTKVHLGNMNQRTTIAGVSTDETPGAGVNITSGGLLAQGQQGVYERDVFAFAPEANFKLAYRFRRNVLLSAGYSFIYWDNVALTGDAVDTVISDASQLNTGTFGPRPAFVPNDSSLWVQGLDLGVIIDF